MTTNWLRALEEPGYVWEQRHPPAMTHARDHRDAGGGVGQVRMATMRDQWLLIHPLQ